MSEIAVSMARHSINMQPTEFEITKVVDGVLVIVSLMVISSNL
jgi:hypothetical protein